MKCTVVWYVHTITQLICKKIIQPRLVSGINKELKRYYKEKKELYGRKLERYVD